MEVKKRKQLLQKLKGPAFDVFHKLCTNNLISAETECTKQMKRLIEQVAMTQSKVGPSANFREGQGASLKSDLPKMLERRTEMTHFVACLILTFCCITF